MSAVFVDTSALLALLHAPDAHHGDAVRAFARLEAERASLRTTSYVLVETYALIGRRFGREALARFREEFAPLLDVTWVDEPLHEAGLDILAEAPSGKLSVVDAVGFATIGALRITRAFAYDKHFSERGYELV